MPPGWQAWRHRQSFLEDDAGAEEADARHDALRHARGIGSDGVEGNNDHPLVLIDGHQHQQGRREADERVRSEPRGTSVEKGRERERLVTRRRSRGAYENVRRRAGRTARWWRSA